MTKNTSTRSTRELDDEISHTRWEGVSASAVTIGRLAQKYGTTELSVWERAERLLTERMARDRQRVDKRKKGPKKEPGTTRATNIMGWLPFALLCVAAAVPLVIALCQRTIDGLWVTTATIGVVWVVLTTAVVFVPLKVVRTILSILWWVGGVLATLLTVLVPLWLPLVWDDTDGGKLYPVIQSVGVSLILVLLTCILAVFRTHQQHGATDREIDVLEREWLTLNLTRPVLNSSDLMTPLVPEPCDNKSSSVVRIVVPVASALAFGALFLRR